MRICTSDNSVMDFCDLCRIEEDAAFDLYGYNGDDPDGRGNCFAYDAEHPPYEDDGCSVYKCYCCGSRLYDSD